MILGILIGLIIFPLIFSKNKFLKTIGIILLVLEVFILNAMRK